ncbi:hypothetical protein HK405_015033 [Cladochytrium tenue]|nr:hypothetical protein HK405_015033 [Cladochytrium tenue]
MKNPDDFSAWESLIRSAESAAGGVRKDWPEEQAGNLRTVYDHFLSKFPLCFGYWKKYADAELLLDGPEQAERDEAALESELRQKIHGIKSAVYIETQEAVQKRWAFESEIKRPYFHVKPVDEAQLQNWRKYLDFEESVEANNPTRTYILYERCLVACALYEEFWLRKTDLRLAFAAFSEEQGDSEGAEDLYMKLLETGTSHDEAKKAWLLVMASQSLSPEEKHSLGCKYADFCLERLPTISEASAMEAALYEEFSSPSAVAAAESQSSIKKRPSEAADEDKPRLIKIARTVHLPGPAVAPVPVMAPQMVPANPYMTYPQGQGWPSYPYQGWDYQAQQPQGY